MKHLLFAILLAFSFNAYATMSMDEVVKEYNLLKNQKLEMAEPLTEQDKARAKNLIPMDKFLPESKKAVRVRKQMSFPANMALPNMIDLRYRDTPIKSQDNGKCTGYSGVAAIENLLQRNGKIPGLDLSEWHAWSFYGQYSCEAFISALTKNFICDEKYYPQYGKKSAKCTQSAYVKLAGATYIDDNVTAMKDALARGSVVYIGMATPNDMLKCKKVISPNTTAANGGHALLVTGFQTTGTETLAILKNSWGADCGDSGYQYMPMSLCFKSGFYCSMWELNYLEVKGTLPEPLPTVEPTIAPTVIPTPLPTPEPEKVCVKWKRIWWTLGIKKKCVEWE